MAEESEYQRQAREALERGEPLPDFPQVEVGNIAINEIYQDHLKGGFNSQQALYLTAVVIAGHPGIAPSNPSDDTFD